MPNFLLDKCSDDVELALDKADQATKLSDTRSSCGKVFARVRQRIRKEDDMSQQGRSAKWDMPKGRNRS